LQGSRSPPPTTGGTPAQAPGLNGRRAGLMDFRHSRLTCFVFGGNRPGPFDLGQRARKERWRTRRTGGGGKHSRGRRGVGREVCPHRPAHRLVRPSSSEKLRHIEGRLDRVELAGPPLKVVSADSRGRGVGKSVAGVLRLSSAVHGRRETEPTSVLEEEESRVAAHRALCGPRFFDAGPFGPAGRRRGEV